MRKSGRPPWLWIVFTLVLPSAAEAFNLAEKASIELSQRRFEPESMFGWSLQYFREDLYVGAPRAFGSDSVRRGQVFKCPKNTEVCQPIPEIENTQVQEKNNSWFGATIAAGNELYACAPRSDKNENKFTYGECSTLSANGNRFEILANFQQEILKGNTNFRQREFWSFGIFGVSSIVIREKGQENLVVGAPFTPDTQGVFPRTKRRSPQKYSGAIVMVDRRGFLSFNNRTDANYAFQDSNLARDLLNDYKFSGYSLEKGKFFNADEETLSVGAPKANNMMGAVYICRRCVFIKDRPFGFNVELSGSQMGELFGTSQAACDLNGDGIDDLVVGSPFYTPNSQFYNTGRISVFISNGFALKKAKINPQIEMKTRYSGSQFGASMACLGDIDGDGQMEIVVGAPYLTKEADSGNSGAILIYRLERSGLGLDSEPSQVIFASEPSLNNPKGFGFSFSGSGLRIRNQGLAVSAPLSGQVFLFKSRQVLRFKDMTDILFLCDGIRCSSVEKKTGRISAVVVPKIDAAQPFDIDVEIKITGDVQEGRIMNVKTGVGEEVQNMLIPGGQPSSSALRFDFIPTQQDFGINNITKRPQDLQFYYSLTYSIQCSDRDSPDCPMFSSANTSEITEIKEIKTAMLKFNTECSTPTSCMCEMKHQLSDMKTSLYVGLNSETEVASFSVQNAGKEPSYTNEIEVSTTSDVKIDMRVGNGGCRSTGSTKLRCKLPFFPGKSTKKDLPIKVTLQEAPESIAGIKLKVSMFSECGGFGQNNFTQEAFIKVERKWTINITSASYEQDKTWRETESEEEKEKNKFLFFTYQVMNDGPSSSKNTSIYVFVKKSELIRETTVSIKDTEHVCEPGDPNYILVPPSTTLPPIPDYENLVCRYRADCEVRKCDIEPLKPGSQNGVKMEISMELNVAAADNLGVSKVFIMPSFMGLDYRQSKTDIFAEAGTKFQILRISFKEQVLQWWDLILALVLGLVVLFIITVIFKRLNLFSKVRIYKDDLDKLVNAGEDEVELRNKN